MFFRTQTRKNPATGELSIYYRLVENNRNALGGSSQRNIMTVGFMDDVSTEELHRIADCLNVRIAGGQTLFEENPTVRKYTDNLYTRLIKEKRIDRVLDARKRASECDWQRVDINSLENRNVRELGAEWMCLQTMRKLKIDKYLADRGWSAHDSKLALAHIVCRAVYPASELKTCRYMQQNSAICELLELDAAKITKDKLYGITHRLYGEREGLENHLSRRTNELFTLDDKIIIFDLTNTYFEGDMRDSKLAKRGRSKEKRSDCPLIVLALVVNTEGFIKYSAIYQGNMADCKTLGAMIDKLAASTAEPAKKDGSKRIIVIDAGIATEDNLKMITGKGYDYVCVSRSSLKNYTVADDASVVMVFDNKKRPIELIQVHTAEATDKEYYLKVTSPTKSLKENSMNKHFITRYEECLASILKGINTKGGIKKYDKVNQRIGRTAQKYPSVHRLYEIQLEKDDKEVCISMTWEKKAQATEDKESTFGVYFLKTSIEEANEELVWTVYGCIREIENNIRTLKTDLDLRPIFHKTDDASKAHLHLGLMAYRVVNTVRYQLKSIGIKSDWRELVRIMNTQKCVTTVLTNENKRCISVRKCSKPETTVALLYDVLKMQHAPFLHKKSMLPKTGLQEQKGKQKIEMLKDTS